jgi:hypothetical protein
MTTHFIARTMFIIALALIPWGAAPSASAAEQAVKASAAPTQSEGHNAVASDAVEDTLQACLARIPKDATAGQRLVAEHSCKRDQESRQPIQDVPGH